MTRRRGRGEGTIRLGDRDITAWSTQARRDGGIGYIPEDRQEMGLLLMRLSPGTLFNPFASVPAAYGVAGSLTVDSGTQLLDLYGVGQALRAQGVGAEQRFGI